MFWNMAKEIIGFVVVATFALFALAIAIGVIGAIVRLQMG